MVQTLFGPVRGLWHQGVVRYLGIPYAAPPVGPLRWRPPIDPECWLEVRDAGRFGDACAQRGSFYASDDANDFERRYGSEDCLYLNIWAPDELRKRPVLVFIHGGGGVRGAASLGAYEAARLSRELDAVVVSFNYRLGFFGDICVPALQDGCPQNDSGTFWLLDQIQALSWVQKNIAGFGGDPGNVTLLGHSAGGTSVFAVLRSPLARNLFHRVAILSALPASPNDAQLSLRSKDFLARLLRKDGHIRDDAELEKYLQTLGDGGLRSYLYAKTTDELVTASDGIAAAGGRSDGVVLPRLKNDPKQDFPHPVPVLYGAVDNEASTLLWQRHSAIGQSELWNLMNERVRQVARSDVFSLPGYWKFKVSVAAFNFWAHREVEKTAARLASAGYPIYRYRFKWNNQPSPWRELLGAYHGIDLQFLFGNFDVAHNCFGRFSWNTGNATQREAVHASMVAAFKGFIERGNPNVYASSVDWPIWNRTNKVAEVQ